MYHKIDTPPPASRQKSLYVSPANFEQQMRYLKETGYTTLGFGDLVAFLTTGIVPPARGIIITFDDGFKNLYQYAWPILKKYQLKATVFAVVSFTGSDNKWAPAASGREPLLSWQEIRDMNASGIEFGSHSLTHRRLNQLTTAQLKEELWKSKEILEGQLQQPIISFCYPYGAFDDRVRQLTVEAGYSCACSIHRGNNHSYQTRFQLKRVTIHHDTTMRRFRYRLSVFYDWEHQVKELFGS